MDPIMGSLKSLCTASYWSSIETIALDCYVFEKIAFLYRFWRQTDRQTDEQTDRITCLHCDCFFIAMCEKTVAAIVMILSRNIGNR